MEHSHAAPSGAPAVVGPAAALRRPRDYLTAEPAGVPVLVVRQPDGTLRAFLNVCRHRGVRVVTQCSGNRRSFTCPYHGWTYGAEGELLGIPYRRAFTGVVREERGLTPVAVQERHGLVWVRSSGRSDEVAGPLGLDIPPAPLELDGFGVLDFHQDVEERAWPEVRAGVLGQESARTVCELGPTTVAIRTPNAVRLCTMSPLPADAGATTVRWWLLGPGSG